MRKTAILLTAICATALIYVSCSSDHNEDTVSTNLGSIGASVAVDTSNEMDLNSGLLISTSTSSTGKTAETPAGICATITITTPNGGDYPKVF